MEIAAYKLFCLVESYATHPGHAVGKFVKLSGEKESFGIAFDAVQLFGHLICTSEDGMELLCTVLRKFVEIHEVTVGTACRVNFIIYVVLHAYHTLAKEAVMSQRIGGGLSNLGWGTSSPFPSHETNSEDCDARCCWRIMNNFLQELRAKGHSLDPTDVLEEVASSIVSAGEGMCDADGKKAKFLSPRVLHEYLQRTFAYDPLSWGYRAGKLAVDCFLHIRSRLIEFVVEMETDKTQSGLSSLHTFVEKSLYRVSNEGIDWLPIGGNEGFVVPGIAFIRTVRMKRSSDTLLGTCVCAPTHAFGKLVENEGCRTHLLLMFSQFPDAATEEGDFGFRQLALMVKNVEKGLLVIVVQSHVGEETLRRMESWGNHTRTVLVLVALGKKIMTQLALAFRVLPRPLGLNQQSFLQGSLFVKPLFGSHSLRHCSGVELRSFLLALNPLNMEGVQHPIVSVVFGGRCAADQVLVERLFSRQLHHLVNMLCLPAPLNVVMPAGGVVEAYAIQHFDKKLHEKSMESDISLRCFEIRLIGALRSAIIAYMESVLQNSGGLTVEATLEHLALSQERFAAMDRDAEDRESNCNGFGAFAMGSALPNPLYSRFVPTPPLTEVSGATWAEKYRAKPTLLLADLREWEAQVELVSTYLTIGMCLDHLCFTSIMGRRSAVRDSEEDTQLDELFFFPDIV
ncbi:DNA primase large subunit [Trypanosoma cruzi]|nr:DNA primase large subunit [Trypanosoma cruzi]